MNVFFREGQAVYTDLISSKDLLGRILLEEGMISKEAFNASSLELLSTREHLGRILIRMGALKPPELNDALRLQLRRKLLHLFTMVQSPFAIFAGDHLYGKSDDDSLVRDDCLALIHQGVRTHFTSQRVIPELEKLDGQLLQVETPLGNNWERYALKTEELALIHKIRVKALPLHEIYQMSELPRIEIQQLLYTLLVTEAACIVVQDDEAEESASRSIAQKSPLGQEFPPPEDEVAVVGFEELEATPIYEPPPPPFQPSVSSYEEDAYTPVYMPQGESEPPPATQKDSQYSINRTVPPKKASPVEVSSQTVMERRQLVKSTYQRLQDQNYYEVLGVESSATTLSILDAYHDLIDIYHPDQCAALGLNQLMPQAEEIFKRIKEAYDTLSSPQLRQEYDDKLKHGFGERELQNVVLAEMAFQKGVALFRQKNFKEALIQFNESCRLNDGEGEHVAWAAWSRFCDPQEDREQLIPEVSTLLDRAIELSPLNPICHYFRGQVFLAVKDEVRAKKCFTITLDLDEDHLEAIQQLRLINMRAEKAHLNQGFLGRRRKK